MPGKICPPNIIYIVAGDLGEENDLTENYPEMVKKIDSLMDEAHEYSQIFFLNVRKIKLLIIF